MNLPLTDAGITILNEVELENPEIVFQQFFECFDLKESKEQVREAMKILIKQKFSAESTKREKDNAEFFAEKMEKVLEAAYLLYH